MDTTNFIKWLKEKLIPNLPPNGIVVIDNALYHSTQIEKLPSSASLKSEMQKWLSDNNIPYEERMTKRELYHLIVVNKPPKTYIVDELLKQHGHEVLRLPPYHCDLNPIEYIWNLTKQRVADKNIDQSERQIETLTKEAIASITTEDWRKEINHVERLEKQYWDNDRLQEIQERELIISVGGEESDESESEFEDDNGSDTMSGVEPMDLSSDDSF
ncbi:uncharacterized protein LOC123664648 [Melitaea cinxia]|uniref:uncharacterized protein LOC123664648 n=1 Tax=Melitaea cinxia TaxID=113334 RepID=UPI001E272295|nr:uncharacterized protein LOC123664648 [Melitaea cinxia]